MKKGNLLFNKEQRIIHHLLLKAPFIPSTGLLTGQLGIALAFFAYYRHTNCTAYEDFANELLNNALESLDNSIDITFKNGLTGIGWGIEYLIKEGFVEGCGVEICENIDQKIMESDPRRIFNLSLDQGMEGLLHYVLIHISASSCHLYTAHPADSKQVSSAIIPRFMKDLGFDVTCLFC